MEGKIRIDRKIWKDTDGTRMHVTRIGDRALIDTAMGIPGIETIIELSEAQVKELIEYLGGEAN